MIRVFGLFKKSATPERQLQSACQLSQVLHRVFAWPPATPGAFAVKFVLRRCDTLKQAGSKSVT